MPQFIGRPNLPTSLANKLVQMASMRNQAIAKGGAALGQGLKGAAETYAAGKSEEEAKAKKEELRQEDIERREQERREDLEAKVQKARIDYDVAQKKQGLSLQKGPGATPKMAGAAQFYYGASPEQASGMQQKAPEINDYQGLAEYIMNSANFPNPNEPKPQLPEDKALTEARTEALKADTAQKKSGTKSGGGADASRLRSQVLADRARLRSTIGPDKTVTDAYKVAQKAKIKSLDKKLNELGYPDNPDFEQDLADANAAMANPNSAWDRKKIIEVLKKKYPGFDESLVNDEMGGKPGKPKSKFKMPTLNLPSRRPKMRSAGPAATEG